MVYLYTDRVAFRPWMFRPASLFYLSPGSATGTVDEFALILKENGADYLLRSPMPGFAEEKPFDALIREFQQQHPECLQQAYQNPQDSRFVVYRVVAGCAQ